MQLQNMKTGWQATYLSADIVETPSTLLIPGSLSKKLELQVKSQFGSCWRSYLNYLLNRYSLRTKRQAGFQISNKLKKKYQHSGLKLQRKNFRPNSASWQLLRELAELRGLSICLFFVELADYDLKKQKMKSRRPGLMRHPIKARPRPHNIHFFSKVRSENGVFSRGIRLVR